MRINQRYSREELEFLPMARLKRLLLIPRQVRLTRTQLLSKVMKKMDEIFPGPSREELENQHFKDLKQQYAIPWAGIN